VWIGKLMLIGRIKNLTNQYHWKVVTNSSKIPEKHNFQ
jgi:hypothetical protein